MRTHSGEHIRLREFLPLLVLSNLMTFCAGPTSRLTDQEYITNKLMIDVTEQGVDHLGVVVMLRELAGRNLQPQIKQKSLIQLGHRKL